MNDLQIVKDNAGAVAIPEDFKKIAIQWLTSTGNLQKFTENEKMQFCDICAAFNLNPIKREVYGVKYKDKFNIIVGYESYIKRAERSGRLNGWECEVIGSGSNMKAIITIYRKDFEKPFKHEVYFDEYNTGMNLWASKPRTMLKKVAIAQGFRMCFSEELGGMPYTADELPEVMATEEPVATPETAPTVKGQATKNISDNKPKNIIAGTKEAAEDAEIVKAYTPEQAAELGEIMNAKFSDGSPIFEADDKAAYREMLMNGEFAEALALASEEKKNREKSKVLDGLALAFGGEVVEAPADADDTMPLF